MENVIRSANYFRKKALEHVKTTSREFVFITTDHVVEILKSEMKTVLNQFHEHKEEMRKKDKQLHQLCNKIKYMDGMILSYETKYASSKIKFDISRKELNKLKVPEEDSNLPALDERINRYTDEIMDGTWQDSQFTKEHNKIGLVQEKAFYFYGGYVALSDKEKLDYLEDDTVNYYKCIVKDMKE